MASEDESTVDTIADEISAGEREVQRGCESVGVTIVKVIASLQNTSPEELDFHLQSYVDVDALDRLIESARGDITVRLRIDQYIVTVTGERVSCHRM